MEHPTSGGLTQARKRLGPEPLELLFDRVAVPVAGLLTRGAFLRDWRLMAIDGFELDVPDTPANAAAFGYPAGAREHPAFPKVRVVTIGECGSHAKIAAQIGPVGGKGASEQALARRMYPQLEEDWLLIADRGFYNWPDWQAAAATGAALLWRVKADLRLPVLDLLPDGSYLSLVAKPTLHDKARNKLIAAARAGEHLDPAQARRVRVIEYEIPDRDGDGSGELIALITTITSPAAAIRAGTSPGLLPALGRRNRQQSAQDAPARPRDGAAVQEPGHGPPGDLRLPAHPLRHLALICRAATEADIDPDRVKFLRTVRIIRRQAAGPAFLPQPGPAVPHGGHGRITSPGNLNPARRHRSYPRVVSRARHNSYRVKRYGDTGTRHPGPPTIRLVNLPTVSHDQLSLSGIEPYPAAAPQGFAPARTTGRTRCSVSTSSCRPRN